MGTRGKPAKVHSSGSRVVRRTVPKAVDRTLHE